MAADFREEDLVRLRNGWRDGDARAGDAFFRHFCGVITGYFRRRVSRSEDIDDLVHDTFLRCRIADYRGQAPMQVFLFGIAYRVFLEYLRRRVRDAGESLPDEDLLERTASDFSDDPEFVLEQKDQIRLLMKAMRRIPHRYQFVLELRYWEGFSPAEIASILSGSEAAVPESTIRRWKHEALQALESKALELSTSPELREATTMTIMTWRRWALDESHHYQAG